MNAEPAPRPTARGRFATTRWSVVVAAGDAAGEDARDALATLCETYWYPLYAYARRRGYEPNTAQDLTQGFFARLLEKEYVGAADQERGRFRTFLLTAFVRYISKEHAKAKAQKRGGDHSHVSIDFEDGERMYSAEPADTLTPERIFERRWALTLLDRALAALRDDLRRLGNEERFDELKVFLGGSGPVPSHGEVGERLGLSEGAVKIAVHRLRKRYREALRDEIAQTVSEPGAVDDEIRRLMDALSG